MKTGDFIKLTDTKYLTSPNFLQRGDVLVRHNSSGGHTAMALGWKDNGVTATPTAVVVNNGTRTKEQVKEMQKYYKVTADGEWGPKSKAAAGGLGADDAWIKYRLTQIPYPVPTRELKYRDMGDDVKWVQYILHKNKFGLGSEESFVDGEFGSITKAMVIVF